jgi:ribosomal protein S18 acetylase RimI-like enzyme
VPDGSRRVDLQAAAALLARAFHDDPILTAVEPDPARRPAALRAIFAAHLRYAGHSGRVDLAADRTGAAIWIAPGQVPMTFLNTLRTGHALLPLRLGPGAWRRLARSNDYALMLHHRTAPGPHWYLHGIGVDPGRQRHGVGRALLATGIERADHDRLPCYLETANDATLPFYESCGFRIEIRGRVPVDGLPIWAMLRPGKR